MRYPKFLPYPKCWLQGLGLAFYAFPSLLFMNFIFLLTSVPIRAMAKYAEMAIILSLGVMIISYWISISFIYDFFWGKPDPHPQHLKWLPSNNSFLEGFYRALFSIISFLGTALVASSVYESSYRCLYRYFSYSYCYGYSRGWIIATWVIIACYCFHLRELFKEKKRAVGKNLN